MSQINQVTTRKKDRLIPRGLLLQLILLFFLAHPGSAATFDDTKAFLLSRYPNRDVIPSCLIRHHHHHRQRRSISSSGSGSFPSLFIPCPAPMKKEHFRANNKFLSSTSTIIRPVVIGSFVSELEQSDRRPVPPKVNGKTSSSPVTAVPLVNRPSLTSFVATTIGGAATGMFRKSATSIFDAYDGVVNFVGSRLVTTEQTFTKALNSAVSLTGGSHETSLPYSSSENDKAASSSSLMSSAAPPTSSSIRYDLVGYMDLDPFEKSRRYFKRNNSLTKLLL